MKSILTISTLSLILGSGCATQIAGDLWGAKFAIGTSLADPRISEKQATVDGDGVQVFADKHAMSKQFAEMIEATLPELVEQAVRAALISSGIGVVGDLLDGNGIPEGIPEVMEEVVPDAE
ncbi:MAG TPA: hypothetical protein VM537_21405 [Anaerolineae bacterium]|nr:hypothetical protein [Anaerolineae bacterium]